MGKIYAAKTNHITNPIGFNMDTIAFSWKVKGCRGQEQKHARIVISKNKTFTDICYDTGETELDSLSTRVEFEIQPYTRYYWKVIVATDVEEVIESDVQFFETAKMDEPWTGRWITCDSSQERHPIFSKRIEPKKKVKRARLYICGLGLYEAYFLGENKENSEKIGDEYLTPYCNNYDQWIQYQTYDITKQAEQGGVLSVLLGNGWYKGRFGFNDPEREAYYGDEWKLIAEIHIEYKDGTKDVISSDETWSVTRSNLWFSNIYDGERRDDTLPPVEESPARIAKAPKGRLMERLSLPVKVQEEMKPAELIHTPAGEDVFDLGQEIAGIFRLRVHEPAGTTIRIQTGEVLQDGCFYNENLRTALSEYIYVSDGTEKVITPHFTYYGYRYVKVTGVRDLSCEDFTALVLYSDYESIGAIETGNDLVNKLISNIEWGMKGNFLDVPTDCPQRDERLGWTGDAQIFCRTATYLMNTYTFYKKWLHDLEVDQTPEGGVPHVVPNIEEGRTDGNWLLRQGPHSAAAWADAAIINPWTMYLMYGDKDILKKQYNSMKGWIDFMRAHAVDYIWNYKLQFGDWVALDAEEGSYFGATPNDLTCTAYYAYSTGLFVQMAKALGKEDVAAEYEELYHKIVKKFQETFFDAEGNMTAQTQTAHIVALYFQLTPEKYITKTVEGLKRLLDKENGHLVTGFVGTPYFCHALSQNHALKDAYDLLLKEDFPSWLYQVKKGATTIWEHWDGLKDDGSMWSADMNSFNHYAYGAIGEWMYRAMAGIEADPEQPGFKHAVLYPRIGGNLKYTEGNYHSVYGNVGVKWEVQGKQITLTVQIPVNTTAEIRLDQAKAVVKSDGLTFTKAADYMSAEAGSGTYHIVFEQ